MSRPLTVGIAGAGLLGRLLGWRLAAAGASVTLYEQGAAHGHDAAGYTAAAMLAPWSERPIAEPEVFELGQHALDAWPTLIAAIEQDSGISIPLNRNGTVVVAHAADDPLLDKFERALRRHVGDDPRCKHIDQSALAKIEPTLAERFKRALWMTEEGGLANDRLFEALLAALQTRGATMKFEQPVRALGPRWIESDSRTTFDWVVDCRGFGAKADLSALRGVRGEIIRVRAPDVDLSRPVRLMHPRYPLYVVPRDDHGFVIGATEIESEHRGPVTVRSSLELLSALFSLHPGFAEAEIESMHSNLRPAFPDHRPRMTVMQGYLCLNGLYRHGYLLAPQLTEWAREVVINDARPEHALINYSNEFPDEDTRQLSAG